MCDEGKKKMLLRLPQKIWGGYITITICQKVYIPNLLAKNAKCVWPFDAHIAIVTTTGRWGERGKRTRVGKIARWCGLKKILALLRNIYRNMYSIFSECLDFPLYFLTNCHCAEYSGIWDVLQRNHDGDDTTNMITPIICYLKLYW